MTESELLLIAVRNLIKKLNFIELCQDSDAKYEYEINTYLEKYVIKIEDISYSMDDLITINNIVNKLNDLKYFTESDVSELFGIDFRKLTD